MSGDPGPERFPDEELIRFVDRLQELHAALVRMEVQHDEQHAEINAMAIEGDRLERLEVGEALGRIVGSRGA